MHSPLQNTEHITIYLRDTPLAHRIDRARRPSELETGEGRSDATLQECPGAGSPLVGEGSDALQGHLDCHDQVMGIAARFYPEVAALDSRDETGGEGFGVGVSA